MLQSNDEILRIADEYNRGFAPADLIRSGKNSEAMLQYAIRKYGLVSISYLIEAEKTLGVQLQREKQPTPEERAAEQARRSEAKMRRDYLDSLKPQRVVEVQNLAAQKAAVEKKEAQAKELKYTLSQIEHEINNYSVGHPSGSLDYSRTESGRDELRLVRDQHDRRTLEGASLALAAVRKVKSKLP